MMRCNRVLTMVILAGCFVSSLSPAGEQKDGVFSSYEEKEKFAGDLSRLIGDAWQKWQDSVSVNGIEVEGANGFLSPGDLGEPVLQKKMILLNFDTKGRSYEYMECVKTVADAVAGGMRAWQRGYRNMAIPFPDGAVCTFTLTECQNVPVSLASGYSPGDIAMDEDNLYNYMIFHTPFHGDDIYEVYKAAAQAIAFCFKEWLQKCLIVDIRALGGIAPGPGPMGPGPVRGAKGNRGKLRGEPFCSDIMYNMMLDFFSGRRQNGT